MKEISIIIPTLGRPERLKKTLSGLDIDDSELQIIILYNHDDTSMRGFSFKDPILPFELPTRMTAIQKWNIGARISCGKYILLAQDDIEFPLLWKEKALSTPNNGFIGFQDGHGNEEFYPDYMATRNWLRLNQGGVLVVPHYKSWCGDLEIRDRAMRVGDYVCGGTIIHNHVFHNPFLDDETYRLGRKNHDQDFKLYEERKRLDFPNDFEGVL